MSRGGGGEGGGEGRGGAERGGEGLLFAWTDLPVLDRLLLYDHQSVDSEGCLIPRFPPVFEFAAVPLTALTLPFQLNIGLLPLRFPQSLTSRACNAP